MCPTTDARPVVLVANRGEVARRVIRTCNRLGVATVAVFTGPDVLSPHVTEATVAVCLGDSPREYTNAAKLVQIAKDHGCVAVHPGYGFLSENVSFCEAITAAGVAWLGPDAPTMHDFSLKHVAKDIARKAGVPVLEGSGLVDNAGDAIAAANKVGYPVLLKATGGGGGMGIYMCRSDADISAQLEKSQHQGETFFGNSGVFVEKFIQDAHHVEVQIFGDGQGNCVHLHERECSIQRRNQKVLEETPSPLVDEAMRLELTSAAVQLGKATRYRSAGTVEFLVDEDTKRFYLLEVNTRLQVEHGITEMAHGDVDIVEAQLRLQIDALQEGGNDPAGILARLADAKFHGHCIEVRINGEDPAHDFAPAPGLLGHVYFPEDMEGVRVDGWVSSGTEVSPHYDSLLAKLMVWGPTRQEAARRMAEALAKTKLQGMPNNLEFLQALVKDERFLAGNTTTRFLEKDIGFVPHVAQVLVPGLQTSVQDWPGRIKLWHVGVPPSGPMDALAHRLANALVGNDEDAAALEFTLQGPTIKFHCRALVALAGARFGATIDGQPAPWNCSFMVEPGQVLALDKVLGDSGVRGYLAVRGGIDVPLYLGSRSTFPGGKFGGYQGRNLRQGDSLPLSKAADQGAQPTTLPDQFTPQLGQSPSEGGDGGATRWNVGVLPGPHADPDFITSAFMEEFTSEPFSVHYNSNRLGIRMVGPKPEWVRPDGGEGGTHPSNVHDHVYAIGAINFTGDHPVVLMVDGPSLGGFVCPATITSSELWKMGQVRPNDEVVFQRLTIEQALVKRKALDAQIAAIRSMAEQGVSEAAALQQYEADVGKVKADAAACPYIAGVTTAPLLQEKPPSDGCPGAQYRLAGDRYIQVEYGPMELDIKLRVRVDCLEKWLAAKGIEGLVETSPGVRSLMVEYDITQLPTGKMLEILQHAESELPDVSSMVIPSRIMHLPMAFDDRWTREALDKYMKSVRESAPYLPDNIQYIANNNGLEGGKEEVRRIIFDASYLVLGLGDVYLGAPCAVPVNPLHRLVTSKMNPARTFTAEGTVGIGGSYMCVYPMDSPGGYQLVGRTLPIWNTFGRSGPFSPDAPWLLRFFDQVRYYQVSEDELVDLRAKFTSGQLQIKIEESTFDVGEYDRTVSGMAGDIAEFKARQRSAMEVQLAEEAASLRDLDSRGLSPQTSLKRPMEVEQDAMWEEPQYAMVNAPFSANVWEVRVAEGDSVAQGDVLVVLEAMKMESPVAAPVAGKVVAVRAQLSSLCDSGGLLVVIDTEA